MKKIRTTPPPPPVQQQSEYPGWRAAAIAIQENGPLSVGKGLSRRKYAVVCSSNVNRSIMAQRLLEKHDFSVKSYGTGR